MLAGCAHGPVDTDELARRNPRLAGVSGQHLDETTPYVWPRAGMLTLFLCRWPSGATIPVALPPGATAEEMAALEAALRAWESAGLGLRFDRVAPGSEWITILFNDGSVETALGDGVGLTVTDCRLGSAAEAGDPIAAEITGAVVRVARRTPKDIRHRDKPLTQAEIAGIALHEIGHALGFQGHVSSGDTAMVRSRDDVSARGRSLMRGERLSDATLRALYVLPPGAVVRRAPVSRARTEAVDRLAEAAAQLRMRGPFVRVGDRDGRVFWRDAVGEEYGVGVADVLRTLKEPERLVLLPEPRTQALLGPASP